MLGGLNVAEAGKKRERIKGYLNTLEELQHIVILI